MMAVSLGGVQSGKHWTGVTKTDLIGRVAAATAATVSCDGRCRAKLEGGPIQRGRSVDKKQNTKKKVKDVVCEKRAGEIVDMQRIPNDKKRHTGGGKVKKPLVHTHTTDPSPNGLNLMRISQRRSAALSGGIPHATSGSVASPRLGHVRWKPLTQSRVCWKNSSMVRE